MVSLRFPFSFPRPPRSPCRPIASSHPFSSANAAIAAAAAAAGAVFGIGVGLAISIEPAGPSLQKPWLGAAPIWASLSLSDALSETPSVEPKTGAAFPTVVDGTRRLLGIGLRRKSVLGLKNVDVYAFGVYVDENDVKKLCKKYRTLSVSELKASREFYADILDKDLRMTVMLQIVYGRLSIRSVRSAFEESIRNRLRKFGGFDNKELLERFTSLFKDEYKLPRGSIIDLSREPGYVLRTKIDGKEIGSIQSKLLCQSILDLYIGEDPFDRDAKEDIESRLASLLQS